MEFATGEWTSIRSGPGRFAEITCHNPCLENYVLDETDDDSESQLMCQAPACSCLIDLRVEMMQFTPSVTISSAHAHQKTFVSSYAEPMLINGYYKFDAESMIERVRTKLAENLAEVKRSKAAFESHYRDFALHLEVGDAIFEAATEFATRRKSIIKTLRTHVETCTCGRIPGGYDSV